MSTKFLYYSPSCDYYMGHEVYLNDRKAHVKATRVYTEEAPTNCTWTDEVPAGIGIELVKDNRKNGGLTINENSTEQELREAINYNNKVINRIRGDMN